MLGLFLRGVIMAFGYHAGRTIVKKVKESNGEPSEETEDDVEDLFEVEDKREKLKKKGVHIVKAI